MSERINLDNMMVAIKLYVLSLSFYYNLVSLFAFYVCLCVFFAKQIFFSSRQELAPEWKILCPKFCVSGPHILTFSVIWPWIVMSFKKYTFGCASTSLHSLMCWLCKILCSQQRKVQFFLLKQTATEKPKSRYTDSRWGSLVIVIK